MFKNKKKLKYINFNNAGASKNPKFVVNKIKEYLDEEHIFGGYYAAEKNKKNIINFYKNLSFLINCHESEISFVLAQPMDGISFRLSQSRKKITLLSLIMSMEIIFIIIKEKCGNKSLEIDINGKICLSSLKEN